MTKSELIEILVAKSNGLSQADAHLAVNIVVNYMSATLASGERIEIRGFGSFSLRHFPARKGRNPKTGETVQLLPRSLVHFKPGLEMRDRVNNTNYRILPM